jgi:hypothetical protein
VELDCHCSSADPDLIQSAYPLHSAYFLAGVK